MQLDDWVLCRIYNKKGGLKKPAASADQKSPLMGGYGAASMANAPPEQKPLVGSGMASPAFPDYPAYYDRPSDSMPRLHADSSCSEQAAVLSPDQFPGVLLLLRPSPDTLPPAALLLSCLGGWVCRFGARPPVALRVLSLSM